MFLWVLEHSHQFVNHASYVYSTLWKWSRRTLPRLSSSLWHHRSLFRHYFKKFPICKTDWFFYVWRQDLYYSSKLRYCGSRSSLLPLLSFYVWIAIKPILHYWLKTVFLLHQFGCNMFDYHSTLANLLVFVLFHSL